MVTWGRPFQCIIIWFEGLGKARELIQDPFQGCGRWGQLQWVPLSPRAVEVLVPLLPGPLEPGKEYQDDPLRARVLADGADFWSSLTGWILNAIGNKKRAKGPIQEIHPPLFR